MWYLTRACNVLRRTPQRRMVMLDRRDFMKVCSGMGLAGTLFPGVLWAQAEAQDAAKITKEMIDNAATVADVHIPDEYRRAVFTAKDLTDVKPIAAATVGLI